LRVIVDEESHEVLGFGTQPLENDPSISPNRVFTGISIVGPALFDYLRAGCVESVITAFERMISDGRRVLGVTVDEGHWFDLGSREALLAAHRQFIIDGVAHAPEMQRGDGTQATMPRAKLDERIHPTARIHPGGAVDEFTVMGPRSVVEAGAIVTGSLLLAGAKVSANCRVRESIVSPEVVVVADLAEQIV
jgi:NDP-sugar pyrophosphorylase family protein